jgi:uncharacterized protein
LIYLDTSVLAPFYWTEASSDGVEQLFQQYEPLIISELSEVELISALSRRVRMGLQSTGFGQQATLRPKPVLIY